MLETNYKIKSELKLYIKRVIYQKLKLNFIFHIFPHKITLNSSPACDREFATQPKPQKQYNSKKHIEKPIEQKNSKV